MEFGPEQDLRRIVETYSSMLLHLAMTRTRCTADAEDAVQEVFLSLLTKKPRFRDGEHEKAWLIRATIHRACDIQRAASSRLLPLEEAQEVSAPEPEEAPQLLSAVQALPEKYSTVVHLYYYEGFTIKEIALIAAVLAVAVMATAAAVNLLHPAQVAEYMGHPALADAFNSEDAILLNESKEFGDFTVTLMGVTSGAHLSDVYEDADAARSYIVAAMSRIDGESIDYADLQGIMVTPLVAGYQPWEVNNFTLGGGYESVIADGMHTAYYIFECGSLEPFADHTIYLACYEGVAPSSDMLQLNQDGSISFLDSYTKPHALFTLPLDSAKADPAKAAAIVDQIRQPSPEAPEEALGDTGDGDVENIVITEEDAARALEQQ